MADFTATQEFFGIKMFNWFKKKQIQETQEEKYPILTAANATEISDLVQKDMVEKELVKILLGIRQQSNCGRYNYFHNCPTEMSKTTLLAIRDTLKSLGYRTAISSSFDFRPSLEVSWAKND